MANSTRRATIFFFLKRRKSFSLSSSPTRAKEMTSDFPFHIASPLSFTRSFLLTTSAFFPTSPSVPQSLFLQGSLPGGRKTRQGSPLPFLPHPLLCHRLLNLIPSPLSFPLLSSLLFSHFFPLLSSALLFLKPRPHLSLSTREIRRSSVRSSMTLS